MSLQRKRMIVLFALLTVWAGGVVARLAWIQLARHDHYVAKAARQHERTIQLTPLRGSIYDARSRLLAESAAAPSIYVDPQAIRNVDLDAAALSRIGGIGLSEEALRDRLSGSNEFAWVARQVDTGTWDQVRALSIPGVHSVEEHRRVYPNRSLLANVLGIVGVDGGGLGGLEHSLDRFVRGESGVMTVIRDARRGMYLLDADTKGAVDGYDLRLTVDEVIQHFTESALEQGVRSSGAKAGVAIVMEPHSGAILAMASEPSFDPNDYGRYPQSSWRNRAVQDIYEPGSTFKIVTAAAAVEEGVVTPSQLVDCGEGRIDVAGVTIRDHGGHQYGIISFEDVLVKSSNVGTIQVAMALGPRRLHDYARAFGFGEQTGLELPGEAAGILRPVDRWSGVSTASIAIGQEIAATPLQMLIGTCVIANGGLRVVPRIVDRVSDENGQTVYEPEPIEPVRVISERTAALMNEMLKAVVDRGTGAKASLSNHKVAGKTGTAQKAVGGRYSDTLSVASFTGYVPADRPRIAIVVLLDEPQSSQYGGEVAGPVFRAIAEQTLRYLEVDSAQPGERRMRIERPIRIAATVEAPAGRTTLARGDGGVSR
ncbi:MAG: penicillin-binding protein 2 [Acidobacteria bacterium]|nr:penicillin-binding protein 2 [Acidobacteriota bacterium]